MSDEIGGDDANDDFYSADAWAEPPVDDFPETILVASSEKSTRDANRESSPRDHDLRPVRRRSQSPSPRNPTFDRRQWHSRSRSKSPSSQRFRKRGRWGDSDDQHNGNTGPRDRGPESFSTGQFEDAPRGGSDHRRGAPRPNHRDGQQQQQQQQQQQRGSGGFQGFHQRAQEQHWRFHQEHQRQRRESLLNAKIKKAQDRVLWVNSLSHLRNVAIDDDTGTVDKFFILALYHHGSGCETTLRDRLQFPYPFAQQSDDLGIWWEDVLQTAKALSTAQGRPDGEAGDIAAKFGVDVSAEAACPTFLFWKKGARLNRPEKISGFTSNNEFQTWMWEHLKVVAIFRNDHSHEVRVFWMKGQVAESNWVVAPGETQRRIVYLSHLFVARDTRVTARHMKKEACLLWHHVRGGSPDVTEDDDYEIVIESKTKDVHTSCWDWAQQGECTKNPNYMVNECPAACNPKTGALAEGHGVGHGEL
mmetsp:Transcript_42184/g.85315  ORF Transcript_42184/g.85315 Transcript_42184/m.85315 type:complete len:474 (-) Transcript_42184:113-1534(-)